MCGPEQHTRLLHDAFVRGDVGIQPVDAAALAVQFPQSCLRHVRPCRLLGTPALVG